ncbi:hypothetical protein [Roseivivax lentus]|uniref:hypothetical protein n=1 Tax=Roseivivax lentus TaxID=633194 RepID=UPI000970BE0D|nr:hypothetical protein [Roseivivax lentus]
MTDDDLLVVLTAMKKALARVSKDACRWPEPETNIVALHAREAPSDEFKRGMESAFHRVWPIWQDVERELIKSGVLSEPTPLTDEEFEAIPF